LKTDLISVVGKGASLDTWLNYTKRGCIYEDVCCGWEK